jgi:hypothetical protein
MDINPQDLSTVIPAAIMLLTYAIKEVITDAAWQKIRVYVPIGAIVVGIAFSVAFSISNGLDGWSFIKTLLDGATIGAAAVGFHQAIVKGAEALSTNDETPPPGDGE